MRDWLCRLWKVFLATAALLGALSFIVPFVEVHHHHDEASQVSAYGLLRGSDQLYETSEDIAGHPVSHPSRIPYYYLAVAAMMLVATAALVRRELGFGGGLVAVACGLAVLWTVTREVLLDRAIAELGKLTTHVTWGAGMLLASGLIALISGVGVLALPDRKGFRPPRKTIRLVVDGVAHMLSPDQLAKGTADLPRAKLRRR